MRDGSLRYILLFLIAIGLVIFVAVLIFQSIGRERSNPAAKDTQELTALTQLADTNTAVRMTIQGPIVAESQFRSVAVTVNAAQVNAELRTGYTANVDNRTAFANNGAAYRNFLRALELSGFAIGAENTVNDDYMAQCPGGQRFIFDIVSGGTVTERYWATSCGGSLGSLGRGVASGQLVQLFKAQVPDYNTFTSGTNL